ncbi:MAG: TPR repeat-containing protein YrrB [Candidatus Anoxychlamydiales bacterium]|nr:TPR repeat-containing protein YrrB [Candidatus Anoxychlamydiales bacterium]
MEIPIDALNLYEKALNFYYKNDYDKAFKLLSKSLKIEPNFAEAMSYLANIHRFLEYKKTPKESVFKILEKALKINPSSAIVWKNLGIGYTEIINDLEKAMECFKKAIKIKPNIKINLNIGTIYFQKGDFDTAIEYYKKVNKKDPQYRWALTNIGFAFQEKKSHKKAIEFFEKVVRLDPPNIQDWINLISCYISNQDLNRAFETIDRAELNHPYIYENFISTFSASLKKDFNYKKKLYEILKSSKKAMHKDDTIKILKEGQRLMINEIDLNVLINSEEENPDFFMYKYKRFREIQIQLKNYATKYSNFPDLEDIAKFDLNTNFKEFILSFDNTTIT